MFIIRREFALVAMDPNLGNKGNDLDPLIKNATVEQNSSIRVKQERDKHCLKLDRSLETAVLKYYRERRELYTRETPGGRPY